jgi:hypothetical protein
MGLLDVRKLVVASAPAAFIALAEGGDAMTMGPVEYLVVAFPDGNVSGEIAPELADLGGKKVIRILDAVFVTKDTSGDVTAAEFGELGNLAGFAAIDAGAGGPIGPGDISFAGAELGRALPRPRCWWRTCGRRPWPARWTAAAAC